MTREQASRFLKDCASALGRCVLEDTEVLVPVILVLAVSAFLWIIGVVVYDLMFDAQATNVAVTLDSLSINPDKWFPSL